MAGVEGFHPGENGQEASANLTNLLSGLNAETIRNTRGVGGEDIASVLASMRNVEGETVTGRGEVRAGVRSLHELPVDPNFARINPDEATSDLLRAVNG